MVHLVAVAALAETNGFTWDEVVPISARTGEQVELLTDLLIRLLPEGEAFFPADQVTDEPVDVRVAELIREAALEGVRDELPHSIAVVVDEMLPREDRPAGRPMTDIHATLYVERTSQKSIIIGHKGERLRDVGQTSRRDIEALLGVPVDPDRAARRPRTATATRGSRPASVSTSGQDSVATTGSGPVESDSGGSSAPC